MNAETEQMQEEDVPSIAQIPQAIQIFEQTPWCVKLLRDPSLIIHQPLPRDPEIYKNNYDAFIFRTLATPDTIRAHLTLRPRVYTSQKLPASHQFIAHGGAVATLLDEGLGVLISLNDNVETRENAQHKGKTLMTIYLNITYRKPVPVPAVILCRARFERIDGRKNFIKGALENGNGTVLAEADSFFLELKGKTNTQEVAKI